MRKQKKSERTEKQIKRLFKRKIRSIFQDAGFSYIPTNDHEMCIGARKVEIDALFVYKNIWLLCEDTIKTTELRAHARNKNEATQQIKKNLTSFIEELVKLFPEKEEILKEFPSNRIKLYSLYIPKGGIKISGSDEKLFSDLIFIQPKTLNYFRWIVQCIKVSARNEIFRFLGIKKSDIGPISSARTSSEKITAPIIYPQSFTGLDNNVRMVSFMMSAQKLLETCYVMRKDNWDASILLYQRLIEKSKIKGIRNFLEKEGAAFYNNIIVALPDTVQCCNPSEGVEKITEITDFKDGYELIIPNEINSICVIDGQHRIFAHYESGYDSEQERCISELRKKLHLLVTGLVFPKTMDEEERVRIQSKIFLDINSNAKPVPPNVLLQIKRIQNPIADESIAQFVIEKLNSKEPFENSLQLSTLDEGKIKTASIVRFALRYLVTSKPKDGKQSLYTYWNGDKEEFTQLKESAIEEYVNYCAKTLREYFCAIRKNFKDQWYDNSSKLLSVISINGFIIAMTRQIKINGVKDFKYYDNVFKEWEFDFSREGFKYTSSQYRKFSSQILKEAFKFEENDY